MNERRLLVHALALIAAPLVVAVFGWSSFTALLLVIVLLLWRWAISMSALICPEKVPAVELETIAASHFVEKVRWCLDRLGIDYVEKPVAGTLGVFFRGRTVPLLKLRTGAVRSYIGNSPEILRYLWGRYAHEDPQAAFLEPLPARVDLEKTLDRLGVHLQRWVYYRILDDRELTLSAWGVDDPGLPIWQRQLLRLLFPLQSALIRRAFRIGDESFAASVAAIEETLADIEARLDDGAHSLLGDAEPNYTDFALAAMVGLWLMPDGYGGEAARHVRLSRERLPEPMRMDVESWAAAYPRVVDFVTRLYRDERAA